MASLAKYDSNTGRTKALSNESLIVSLAAGDKSNYGILKGILDGVQGGNSLLGILRSIISPATQSVCDFSGLQKHVDMGGNHNNFEIWTDSPCMFIQNKYYQSFKEGRCGEVDE